MRYRSLKSVYCLNFIEETPFLHLKLPFFGVSCPLERNLHQRHLGASKAVEFVGTTRY
jgi:hypothetical protein